MKSYRISSSGRRTAIILLLGALAIWVFAIWTFGSTLGLGVDNPPALTDLTISQIVPALLMLVLIIATPLVIWNILEEWASSYTPTEEGLRFQAFAISLTYPWSGMSSIRRSDAEADEPIDELVLKEDYTGQIANPILRLLHAQAYGRTKLPIYAGLADRDELLAEIRERAGLAEQHQPEIAHTHQDQEQGQAT